MFSNYGSRSGFFLPGHCGYGCDFSGLFGSGSFSYLVTDPAYHAHSDPTPEPTMVRILSDPVSAKIFKWQHQSFYLCKNVIFGAQAFFSTYCKAHIYAFADEINFSKHESSSFTAYNFHSDPFVSGSSTLRLTLKDPDLKQCGSLGSGARWSLSSDSVVSDLRPHTSARRTSSTPASRQALAGFDSPQQSFGSGSASDPIFWRPWNQIRIRFY